MRILVALFSIFFINSVAIAEIGDDGLHKEPWLSYTFKDIREDSASAIEQGKHLMLIYEQRGCIYCTEMHEKVFSDPEIAEYITNHFMVVQYNMDGSEEIVDTDGESLEERDAFDKWGFFATPTMVFLPDDLPENGENAAELAIKVVPGSFGRWTTLNMLKWVNEGVYKSEPNFQKYHAKKIEEARAAGLL